jgi:hypothetical protein
MRRPAEKLIQFALASAERLRVVCNLPSTELDSSIRRYRARFCKAVDFANSKLTHHRNELIGNLVGEVLEAELINHHSLLTTDFLM